MDDFAQSAFIKVNGSFEGLEIYDAMSKEGFVKQNCSSEHYGLDIDLKEVSNMDETWEYEGTIKINKIDGGKATYKVMGECGC